MTVLGWVQLQVTEHSTQRGLPIRETCYLSSLDVYSLQGWCEPFSLLPSSMRVLTSACSLQGSGVPGPQAVTTVFSLGTERPVSSSLRVRKLFPEQPPHPTLVRTGCQAAPELVTHREHVPEPNKHLSKIWSFMQHQ